MIKKISIAVTLVVLILFFVVIFIGLKNTKTEVVSKSVVLTINNISINALVADTDYSRTKGLSGRDSLAPNEGLLFVFDREGYQGFWMKEMNFPIDIVWLNKDKKIVHIEHNVSPDTYPKIFNPNNEFNNEKSLYVLETNANFFKDNNIEAGDFVNFNLK
jgi:uncharacterized protein